LFVFVAVVLMTRGFDAAATSAKLRRCVAGWLILLGAILGAGAALPGLWTPLLEGLIPNSREAFALVALRGAAAHLLLASFFGLPGALRRRGPVIPAFLVLAAIDVLSSTRDFIRTRSIAEMEAKPKVVAALQRLQPVPRVVDFLPDEPAERVAGAEVI